MDTRLQSNEVRIPKPEFDLKSGIQCQYFQSSFARSLMLNQSNFTRSLDIPLNFDDHPPAKEVAKVAAKEEKSPGDEVQSPDSGEEVTPMEIKDFWLNSQRISPRKTQDSTECEVLRLRKKCQNLIEENRRLHCTSSNAENPQVEMMILQNKVDTLKWQMQQIESSRQMYRALMESVAHFLKRCHTSLDAMQQESLSRSKSALQIDPAELPMSSSPTRPRSTTNMSDLEITLPRRNILSDMNESTYSIQTVSSYSNFRDFTWRRTPRHSSVQNQTPGTTMDTEKLSQEAFRLLRNVNNLLNTHEPMLANTEPTIDDSLFFLTTPAKNLLFAHKLDSRESRSSLRSTSDSNSTASSKPETDEEMPERPSPIPCQSSILKPGCIEDESGFSSMSSFQEIGLPLISTPRSSSVSSDSTAPDPDPPTTLTKVGIPLTNLHRCWGSAPAVPPKKAALRSRLLKEDESMRVLWV
ncbi:uncharacterized protein LOC132259336 [Phlebotomus argentipes]|uniref:uncharacterized protein LOC132259336 n=1 Tax=Phlebotomus argentipes TaxID=94469 RepID=UPI002892F1AB|nr:uncharacterized protein LOC132259336 [Phlebotomus argentipes]